MANNFYPCISTADLKTINGADLNNNDIALVATSDSAAVYYLSATSGATESLPTIVAPTSNAGAKRWLMTLSTGWEGGMLKIVTQTAHGFVVGDVLYNNAGTYEKAIATSEPTAEVIGIVSSVLDANHFYLLGCGYITGLSGLTAGTVYFLSTTVAGATQATEPTTDGEISKPILIADSTTTAYFVNMRGVEIGDTTSLFVSDEAYGATWHNETSIAPSQNAVYDKIEKAPYGVNATASNVLSATQNVYEVGQRKSGFWECNGGLGTDWLPSANWYWGATFAHTYNGAAYNHCGQLAFLGSSQIAYLRTISAGTPTAWVKILTANDISDTAYAASWDGVTGIAPSKNAVYDRLTTVGVGFVGTTFATSTDWNDLPTEFPFSGIAPKMVYQATTTGNRPSSGNLDHFYVQHLFYNAQVTQIAWPYANSAANRDVWFRSRYEGTWTAWVKILDANDISDTAYGSGWDEVTTIAPSKNAVYDAIELYRFPRVTEISSHATPTINTNDCDAVSITAQAEAITSMTTNLSGAPKNFQKLIIRIKDNGSPRAITWGTSFFANGTPLPTTTVTSKLLTVGFIYDSVLSKWGCVAVQNEA